MAESNAQANVASATGLSTIVAHEHKESGIGSLKLKLPADKADEVAALGVGVVHASSSSRLVGNDTVGKR
jgi:hypothetical protein